MNNYVFKLLRYSGLSLFFRECLQRNKVSIILFHDMSVQKALPAFSYLKRHYNIISLHAYLEAVKSRGKLPPKAMIITFDDGLAGNYELLPVIKQLQIPVTIYLCSDIVGSQRHFWFNHNDDLISGEEIEQLKVISNGRRLEELKKYGFEQTKEYDDVQALTHDQIKEMSSWVDFQSHTCFHPILPQCDDNTAEAEIALSKKHLEDNYSFDIYSLSYPNGDYSTRDVELTKAAGYACGITLDAGYNDLHSDLFRLKRLSANEAPTMDELAVKASGCFAILKNLLRKRKSYDGVHC